jgi:hypothetical protein
MRSMTGFIVVVALRRYPCSGDRAGAAGRRRPGARRRGPQTRRADDDDGF